MEAVLKIEASTEVALGMVLISRGGSENGHLQSTISVGLMLKSFTFNRGSIENYSFQSRRYSNL